MNQNTAIANTSFTYKSLCKCNRARAWQGAPEWRESRSVASVLSPAKAWLMGSFVDSNAAKRAVDPKVNRNFSCPYSPISCGLWHWGMEGRSTV